MYSLVAVDDDSHCRPPIVNTYGAISILAEMCRFLLSVSICITYFTLLDAFFKQKI
jgi:hypothetical protein